MRTYYGLRNGQNNRTQVQYQDGPGARWRPLMRTNLGLDKALGKFDWGTDSQASEALAHAILADVSQNKEIADRFYKIFQTDVVAKLAQDRFALDEKSVEMWIASKLASLNPIEASQLAPSLDAQ